MLHLEGRILEEESREKLTQKEELFSCFGGKRQGKKGNAATEYCNMAAVEFLSQTAVSLTKRSSLHPCGVRVKSPDLAAALLYLATSG